MEVGGMDIFAIMLDSGVVVKVILLLLIAASIWSWSIVFERRGFYSEIRIREEEFWNIYRQKSGLNEIYDSVLQLKFSYLKEMFIEGFQELRRVREITNDNHSLLRKHFQEFGMGIIQRSLNKGMIRANIKNEKGLTILATIGSVAPFVGLFGTVWGIINSFTGLSSGGGTIEAVAPGIAEALVATAVGLFAAIPAVWFFNHFSKKNTELVQRMNSFESEFINDVERITISRSE